MSIISFMKKFGDEIKCIEYLMDIRLSDGIECPYCGCNAIYKFKDLKKFECKSCSKRFSIRTGTIFEESKLPLSKWFLAFYLEVNHTKGISSLQLSKDLEITQKTAWFLLQRIRHVIQNGGTNMLDGIVEVDETYVGGKETNKHKDRKTWAHNKVQGDKTPILGMQ